MLMDKLAEAIRRRAETIVFKPDNKDLMLVVREPDESFRGRMKIELPGGGVEEGEEPDEGAIRETAEETGRAVEGLRPLSVPRHRVHFDDRQIRAGKMRGRRYTGEETTFYTGDLSTHRSAGVLAQSLHAEADGGRSEPEEDEEGETHKHWSFWMSVPHVIEELERRRERSEREGVRLGHLEQDEARIQAVAQAAKAEGVSLNKESMYAFFDELGKIAASLSETSPALQRGPLDTLDRRTIRAHRKPNVRFMPLSTQSGKIVK